MFLYNIETKQQAEISNQPANHRGQGFDKDDKNYYYTTNFEGVFYYLMSYNIETSARSLVYKTEWDVVNSYLSKKDSYRVITVNEDAQNKIIVNDSKDGSSLNF